MFETFEHTADIGLRVRAPDLATLLAEAARAMFSVIVPDLEAIRPAQEVALRIEEPDPAYLLVDWLSELLFTFDTRRLVFADFTVQTDHPTSGGLSAVARGEVLDLDRHPVRHEIKAITYHDLTVTESDGGWLAEVIIDV
ncbi:MAG: archease [Planctomycetota bacterium]